MKKIAKTTGSFMVHGLQTEASVPHDRPAVVGNYPIISRAISNGDLTVLGQVPEEVTDEEFAKAYAEAAGKPDFAEDVFVKGFAEAMAKKFKAGDAKAADTK